MSRDREIERRVSARARSDNADVLHDCAFLHGAVYITRRYKAARARAVTRVTTRHEDDESISAPRPYAAAFTRAAIAAQTRPERPAHAT